jgi:hypothetical protein
MICCVILSEPLDWEKCHSTDKIFGTIIGARAAPPGLLQQCRFRSLSAGSCRIAPDLFAKTPPCEPNASAARCGYDFPGYHRGSRGAWLVGGRDT